MRMTRKLSPVFVFICTMFFLFGCYVSDEPAENRATPTRTIPITIIADISPSQTPEFSPTPTNTPLPNTPTFTMESSQPATSNPTWTPVPTISQDAKQTNLIELFASNGECDWPCWWGIQPGVPLHHALELSLALGKSPYRYKNQYSYTISFDELNLPDFDLVFYEKDEIVQSIDVYLDKPSRHTGYLESFKNTFSLSIVLNKYGPPDHVLIQIMSRDGLTYALVLLYESKGFGIKYYGVVNSTEPIQICTLIDDYHLEAIQLFLQDTNAMRSLQDELISQGFLPMESVTSMKIDDFYNIYTSKETTNCMETSIEYWE